MNLVVVAAVVGGAAGVACSGGKTSVRDAGGNALDQRGCAGCTGPAPLCGAPRTDPCLCGCGAFGQRQVDGTGRTLVCRGTCWEPVDGGALEDAAPSRDSSAPQDAAPSRDGARPDAPGPGGGADARVPASDGVVAGDERATSDGGRTACGTSAGSGACLCDAVKRCQPAQGGSTFGLGSESLRVCGRDGDRCTVTAFREIEGGGTAYVCHVPIGEPACDSSINYGSVSKWCEQRSQCNLLMQSCPADVLACP